MFIGTKSGNTILDVLHIGITELIRQTGIPSAVHCTSPDCEIQVESADMSKRVDRLRISFSVRPEVNPNQIAEELHKAQIPNHVKITNGRCSLALPAFEWRQLKQLLPLDRILESHAARSLHSQSWRLQVVAYKRHEANVNHLIELMHAKRASDHHLRAGSPPYIRIDNDLQPLDMPPLSAQDMEEIVDQLGSEEELTKLQAERETSFQYHAAGLGYLRCSGYYKQGAMALALRLIPEEPLPFEQLNIPPIVKAGCDKHRGLFLVCGVTGSGKSTTLAAMVDYINQTRHGRIPCLEILLGNKPIVRDAILEADLGRLYSVIEVDPDMKSFDQYAVELYQRGLVTREEAMSACSNEEAFHRVISGIRSSEGRKILGT